MKGQSSPLRVDLISSAGVVETVLQSGNSRKQEGSLYERIRQLIEEAEAHTQQACIVCGSKGKKDIQGRYVLVLCEEHARQRSIGKLPDIWFKQEEGE